ncbi:7TM receptor with intracellular metal dependent phosphohydrolase [Paenibacillus curdlanolyticus YK9]|uniref:7TM receptor with intracellular metal dependent phosphohydrolase n=1 Tax=Paenibacillus curdlanolyticus YK9 TaxID=717606 RepID=E0I3A3_9BACL|nr:HDIG domain-containing metalloprotein [Paenibacillus curdlanolyticus]EFM12767.1 7TM receptor with intracellular metal dependent phosphohydrolase [Paenibacillus curdlanolyticus YK9]
MNRNKDNRPGYSSRTTGWKQSAGVRYALLFLFMLLFYFNLSPYLVPQTYDVKKGAVSEKTIEAPKPIFDEKATLQAQEKAAEAVEPIYTYVALRGDQLVDQIFARMDQLNLDDGVSTADKIEIYRNEIPGKYDEYLDRFAKSNNGLGAYNESLLEEMLRAAKEQRYTVPEETYYKLPKLSQDQLADMRGIAMEVVRKLMSDQLRDAETARTRVAELINASSLSNRSAREIVQELARYAIMPNKFYDKEATNNARAAAREQTQRVEIAEGDVIVAKGELITAEKYELLENAGLLQDKRSYWPQLGAFLLALLFVVVLFSYMAQSGGISGSKPKFGNPQLLMLLLIFFINLTIMQIVSLAQTSSTSFVGYLAPVATGTMLIALLLDMNVAIVSSFLFAIAGSIIFNVSRERLFDFNYGFVIAVVSFSAIFAVHRASQRSTILKAGIMASLFGAVSVLAIQLLGEKIDQTELIYATGFAFASGLITAVLVIGIVPFFEVTFGILSALKLIELSSPNHPLLRKLLTETPGTYHHSVMVGNLSEAAAESIGADGLLCRVGSFYHDIGKTKRPNYFIENQTNIENPHDSIEPKLSKSIIVAHARDGVDMLRGYNIPKPIRDIAEQHHGTTFLKYFYHKALKQAEEQGVEADFTADDFRYPGPKAQSKEAAIVGIADCVEAAVRSLRKPTMEQIETMIHKIIKDRLDDHQFNECDLTMKELDKIAQTLKEAVIGIFHSRIEYPDDVKPKERLA